jgi:hypothetical protein
VLEVKAEFVNSPFPCQEILVTDVRRLEQFLAVLFRSSDSDSLTTAFSAVRIPLEEFNLAVRNCFPEAPAHISLPLVGVTRRGLSRESTIYGSSQTSRFPIPCWCPKSSRNSRIVYRTPFAPVRVSSWLTRTVGTATGEKPMRFLLAFPLYPPNGLILSSTQWRCRQGRSCSGATEGIGRTSTYAFSERTFLMPSRTSKTSC